MKLIDRRKRERKFSESIIVFYHGDCTDGFGGAWAAWKKFGRRAKYVPLYRGAPLAKIKGKEIYFIDFTLSVEETRKLIRQNKSVTAIDHHISAKEAVAITKNPSFSLNNSGAVLAWNYFHPGKQAPRLLRYVEDRDLWRWKLPHSKEILAGTNFSEQANYNFKSFGALLKKFETAKFIKECIKDGKIVSSVWDHIIIELGDLADWVKLDGVLGLAVNAPHIFSSKLGNYLINNKKAKFGLIWYIQGGEVRISLRSDKHGADVAKIAGKYGGGGHKESAGFLIHGFKNIPWRALKNGKG